LECPKSSGSNFQEFVSEGQAGWAAVEADVVAPSGRMAHMGCMGRIWAAWLLPHVLAVFLHSFNDSSSFSFFSKLVHRILNFSLR